MTEVARKSERDAAFAPQPSQKDASPTPFKRFIDHVTERQSVKRNADGSYTTRCPAHDDRTPSLTIYEHEDGSAWPKCFAGCDARLVCEKFDYRYEDLFSRKLKRSAKRDPTSTSDSPKPAREPPEPLPSEADLQRAQERLHGSHVERRLQSERGWGLLAILGYELGLAEDGRIIIAFRDQAGRLVNIERYAPFERGSVKMLPLKGRSRELLLPPGALKPEILVTEGVSDGIAAVSRGLTAVAAPSASTWKDRWSEQLRAAGVTTAYVVGDSDGAGRKFIPRAAESLARYGIEPLTVDLDPARDDGFDLTDFLLANDGSSSEIEKTLKQLGKPYVEAPDGKQGERRVIVKRASEIRTEIVRWAVQDRAPLGALTMIAGQPGLGKSTYTLALAARASNGTLEGDLNGKPCATLVVTLEDALETVAKPRLLAAKANLDLVGFITVETPEGEDMITLPQDITDIERRVNEHGAKLLVIDPIVATLSGSLDSHRDQDVRRALAPLAKLADVAMSPSWVSCT